MALARGIGEGEKACKQCHKMHSGKTATSPPQALAFAQADQQRVLGNKMHAAHHGQGCECVGLPFRTLEITAADAVERCSDCHAGKIVAAAVWNSHCLACHAFTKTDEHALGTPRIAQRLCEECHKPQAGSAKPDLRLLQSRFDAPYRLQHLPPAA